MVSTLAASRLPEQRRLHVSLTRGTGIHPSNPGCGSTIAFRPPTESRKNISGRFFLRRLRRQRRIPAQRRLHVPIAVKSCNPGCASAAAFRPATESRVASADASLFGNPGDKADYQSNNGFVLVMYYSHALNAGHAGIEALRASHGVQGTMMRGSRTKRYKY